MKRQRHGGGIATIDLLTILLFLFVALVGSQTISKSDSNANALVFTLTWDLKRDADVDMWIKAPAGKAVGYQNTHSLHMDLVRDDLGRSRDPDSRNLEVAYGRDAAAGEYVVNFVLYKTYDGNLPVNATVEVARGDDPHHPFVIQTAVLLAEKQEVTAVRFTLDSAHQLVTGSVNDLPEVLYGIGTHQ